LKTGLALPYSIVYSTELGLFLTVTCIDGDKVCRSSL